MSSELNRYKSIAEGISLLLFPHAEVVIHDLETERIVAIYNSLSKREAGDESLLEGVGSLADVEVFPPYVKMNWDGRKLKSVTAVLRGTSGVAIGLFCINIDISQWEEMHRFLLGFIQPATAMPDLLFKNDWREKINAYVSSYLTQHVLRLEAMGKSEKKQLLLALHKEGAFNTKNAASYVADVLQISRATVYNYLKDKNETI